MGTRKVMTEEVHRHYRAIMDSIPHARHAKNATPEERLAVVARIIDGLYPIIGTPARRARGAPRPIAYLASAPRCQCMTKAGNPCRRPALRNQVYCSGHNPDGRAMLKGTARYDNALRLIQPVQDKLGRWLPPSVARAWNEAKLSDRVEIAKDWLDEQRGFHSRSISLL